MTASVAMILAITVSPPCSSSRSSTMVCTEYIGRFGSMLWMGIRPRGKAMIVGPIFSGLLSRLYDVA